LDNQLLHVGHGSSPDFDYYAGHDNYQFLQTFDMFFYLPQKIPSHFFFPGDTDGDCLKIGIKADMFLSEVVICQNDDATMKYTISFVSWTPV